MNSQNISPPATPPTTSSAVATAAAASDATPRNSTSRRQKRRATSEQIITPRHSAQLPRKNITSPTPLTSAAATTTTTTTTTPAAQTAAAKPSRRKKSWTGRLILPTNTATTSPHHAIATANNSELAHHPSQQNTTATIPPKAPFTTEIRLNTSSTTPARVANTKTLINNPNANAALPGSAASLGYETLEYDPYGDCACPLFAEDARKGSTDIGPLSPDIKGSSTTGRRSSSRRPFSRSQSKDRVAMTKAQGKRKKSKDSDETSEAFTGFFSMFSSHKHFVTAPSTPCSSRPTSPNGSSFTHLEGDYFTAAVASRGNRRRESRGETVPPDGAATTTVAEKSRRGSVASSETRASTPTQLSGPCSSIHEIHHPSSHSTGRNSFSSSEQFRPQFGATPSVTPTHSRTHSRSHSVTSGSLLPATPLPPLAEAPPKHPPTCQKLQPIPDEDPVTHFVSSENAGAPPAPASATWSAEYPITPTSISSDRNVDLRFDNNENASSAPTDNEHSQYHGSRSRILENYKDNEAACSVYDHDDEEETDVDSKLAKKSGKKKWKIFTKRKSKGKLDGPCRKDSIESQKPPPFTPSTVDESRDPIANFTESSTAYGDRYYYRTAYKDPSSYWVNHLSSTASAPFDHTAPNSPIPRCDGSFDMYRFPDPAPKFRQGRLDSVDSTASSKTAISAGSIASTDTIAAAARDETEAHHASDHHRDDSAETLASSRDEKRSSEASAPSSSFFNPMPPTPLAASVATPVHYAPPIPFPISSLSSSLINNDNNFSSVVDGLASCLAGSEPWSPPESWWVRETPLNKSGENVSALKDVIIEDEQDRLAAAEDRRLSADGGDTMDGCGAVGVSTPNGLHCLRIFRHDATFSIVTCALETKTSDLVLMLAKKFFLLDVSKFQLSVRMNGLVRVLGANEKPLQLMRQWFDLAGYREYDGLDDLGREDNSYLCRFIFGEAAAPNLPLFETDGVDAGSRFQHVDFQARNLQTIPILLFRNASWINSLNISRNLSIDIPLDFIQLCSSLREIRISGCNLERVPSSIRYASQLKHLDLSHNFLRELEHAQLENLPTLESLLVDGNKLKSLPLDWHRFSNLTSLSASNNYLEEFPEVVTELTSLAELDLSFNDLKGFPASISRLVNLKRLRLVATRLSGALPEGLAMLKMLAELDIRSNSISNISIIDQLPCLEMILADRNNVAVFVPAKLSSMVQLSLSKNFLTNFAPHDVAPYLTYLNLTGSKISALTGTLAANLPELEHLILDENHLTALPKTLSQLTKLRVLSATRNSLTTIPAELASLPLLETLNLHNNNLKFIPQEIWWCKSLTTLNVSSNLLEVFPMPPPSARRGSEGEQLTRSPASSPRHERAGAIDRDGAVASSAEGGEETKPSAVAGLASPFFTPPVAAVTLLAPYASPSAPALAQGSFKATHRVSRSVSSAASTAVHPFPADGSPRCPLASTLLHLYLGDNNLADDVFVPLSQMTKLRTLNLSFNDIYEIPSGGLFHLIHLTNLHLSGNEISSLPGEEIERLRRLRCLYLNANKLQTLPAELGKLKKLIVLDVGNNSLKYNISNWPYDWNWNWNTDLKYLNFSGNKRLEIKQGQHHYETAETTGPSGSVLPKSASSVAVPSSVGSSGAEGAQVNESYAHYGVGNSHSLGMFAFLPASSAVTGAPTAASNGGGAGVAPTYAKQMERSFVPRNTIKRDLSDFSALTHLRVLGLMDVTLMSAVPEELENRRIRTAASDINNVIAYGMADHLGDGEFVRSWDAVNCKLNGRDDQALVGLFDCGSADASGRRATRYLNDWFAFHLTSELKKFGNAGPKAFASSSSTSSKTDDIMDALRRSYLSLNKELGSSGTEGSKAGASAAVLYLTGRTLYVSNVGDALVVLSRSGGTAHLLSRRHIPWDASELARVRATPGGWISSEDGLVNGELTISRGFGHFHLLPVVNAEPHVERVRLTEQDEFVIMASRNLWKYISYQAAVDIARTERGDPMMAAQKLRDFAITYGAEEGIMVMVVNVGDLFVDPTHSAYFQVGGRRRCGGKVGSGSGLMIGLGMGEMEDGAKGVYSGKKNRRGAKYEAPGDSTLARLDKEVEPPVGQVALVFTDIKSSTFLWENYPIAMRSAIKIHNAIMRRLLRSIGGYEVKTEGDAFMVCFPTVTLALVWCFTVQIQLLHADWPQEILSSEAGGDVYADDGAASSELLYRGLSVRMGVHWGLPVSEIDPVTRRMDYFGPMVNRSARICNVADGGEICISSDVVAKIMALKGLFSEDDDEAAEVDGGVSASKQGQQQPQQRLPRDVLALRKMGLTLVGIGERKLKGLENAEVLSLLFPKCLGERIRFSKLARYGRNGAGAGSAAASAVDDGDRATNNAPSSPSVPSPSLPSPPPSASDGGSPSPDIEKQTSSSTSTSMSSSFSAPSSSSTSLRRPSEDAPSIPVEDEIASAGSEVSLSSSRRPSLSISTLRNLGLVTLRIERTSQDVVTTPPGDVPTDRRRMIRTMSPSDDPGGANDGDEQEGGEEVEAGSSSSPTVPVSYVQEHSSSDVSSNVLCCPDANGGTDQDDLLRVLESLVIRLENAVNAHDLRRFRTVHRFIDAVASAVEMDPSVVRRALEMYTAAASASVAADATSDFS